MRGQLRTTKFLTPRPHWAWVARPRLYDQLEAGMQERQTNSCGCSARSRHSLVPYTPVALGQAGASPPSLLCLLFLVLCVPFLQHRNFVYPSI